MSVTRITGMATGMDTDSIIKKLMDVEKMPLNRLKQNQQKQLWLIDSYRQWNSDIFAFRNTTLFNMKLSGAYNTYEVGSTLSNSVSGTTTATTVPGTYSIQVNELARAATFTSNSINLDTSKPLFDQGKLAGKATISIDVVNSSTDSTATQSADLTIETTHTINDVVANINNAVDKSTGKSLGLQAYYDSNLKQFIIKTKATGETTKIDFSNTTDSAGLDFLNNTVGIGTTAEPTNSLKSAGTNADILFNGKLVENIGTNDINLMGINFSLKSKTVDLNGNLTSSTITVTQNIDNAIKNIKGFVDKYNELIDKMNKATAEAVYRDFLPLTDDQKIDMSEKEIELWEGKAKSGLLRGDSLLKDLVNKMRYTMSSIVDNGSSFNSLASIGISSKSYQDRGKLYVDETKLKAAFQADPESVQKIFNQTGETSKNGLVNRLSDMMQQGIKDLTSRAGMSGNSQYDQSVIGKLLTRLQNDITKHTDKLTQKENQYYKQFAAMESAVAKFNSQSSWLYSQFNSGM
jgi:flagellar hook-associated protein 2